MKNFFENVCVAFILTILITMALAFILLPVIAAVIYDNWRIGLVVFITLPIVMGTMMTVNDW